VMERRAEGDLFVTALFSKAEITSTQRRALLDLEAGGALRLLKARELFFASTSPNVVLNRRIPQTAWPYYNLFFRQFTGLRQRLQLARKLKSPALTIVAKHTAQTW